MAWTGEKKGGWLVTRVTSQPLAPPIRGSCQDRLMLPAPPVLMLRFAERFIRLPFWSWPSHPLTFESTTLPV